MNSRPAWTKLEKILSPRKKVGIGACGVVNITSQFTLQQKWTENVLSIVELALGSKPS